MLCTNVIMMFKKQMKKQNEKKWIYYNHFEF